MTDRRPSFHFAPHRNWLNDPNGLVYLDGRYHLFFQHNPEGTGWGNMSWGHASSSDLIQWTQHPVAISHRPGEQIFSGSVVADHGNTSGLADGPDPVLVALYTSVAVSGIQAQSLAHSTDRGITWTRHPGNPLIDRGSKAFRDPKVIRYRPADGSAGYWVLAAVEAEQQRVIFYRSDDLLHWEETGTFTTPAPAGQLWECPDMFPLELNGEQRWVLIISVNPDQSTPGSATRYFTGTFDGSAFTPEEQPPALLDLGPDCYGLVTFDNAPGGRRIGIGWMSNWAYAASVPTAPWRGEMTIPRELSLVRTQDGLRLAQHPIAELAALSAASHRQTRLTLRPPGTEPIPLTGPSDITIQFPDDRGTVSIDLFAAGHTEASLHVDTDNGLIRLRRRSHERLPGVFAEPITAPLPVAEAALRLRLLLDEQSLEVFTADGTAAISMQLFPVAPWSELLITATDGRARSPDIAVRELPPVRWPR
jgi:sucrose-6-phosphate hydrolase SacC (GH32 family)